MKLLLGALSGSIPFLGTQASKLVEASVIGRGSKYFVSLSLGVIIKGAISTSTLGSRHLLWPKEKLVEYCRGVEEAFVKFVFSKSYQQVIVYKVRVNAQTSLTIKIKYFP